MKDIKVVLANRLGVSSPLHIYSGESEMADDITPDSVSKCPVFNVKRVCPPSPDITFSRQVNESLLSPPNTSVAPFSSRGSTFEFDGNRFSLSLHGDTTIQAVKAILTERFGDLGAFSVYFGDSLLDVDVTLDDVSDCEIFRVKCDRRQIQVEVHWFSGSSPSSWQFFASPNATLADIESEAKSIANLGRGDTKFLLKSKRGRSVFHPGSSTPLWCLDLKQNLRVILESATFDINIALLHFSAIHCHFENDSSSI
jgi:hypothetical protein